MKPNYSKLWVLLKEKHISKTDISELTGLSSRTVAKLSSNSNVNTETLAKICDVLGCNVQDIMEFESENNPSSVFDAYISFSRFVSETEFTETRECEYEGIIFSITKTKSKANKHTQIICKNRDIIWDQRPALPLISPSMPEISFGFTGERVIYRIPELSKDKMHLFVIDGKPDMIIGLDEGIFRSSRHKGGSEHMHTMSYTAFKLF